MTLYTSTLMGYNLTGHCSYSEEDSESESESSSEDEDDSDFEDEDDDSEDDDPDEELEEEGMVRLIALDDRIPNFYLPHLLLRYKSHNRYYL